MIKYKACLLISRNSRCIGAIGWLIYYIYIGIIIVYIASSIVLVIGSGS